LLLPVVVSSSIFTNNLRFWDRARYHGLLKFISCWRIW